MENSIMDIDSLLKEIKEMVRPAKVILFHRKVENEGKTLSFKICIITQNKNKFDLEKEVYKNIDSDIPFDIIVYTSSEWERLKLNDDSFASKILSRGFFIDEPE